MSLSNDVLLLWKLETPALEPYVKCDLAQLRLRRPPGFHLTVVHAAGQTEALFGCLSQLIPFFLLVSFLCACGARKTMSTGHFGG